MKVIVRVLVLSLLFLWSQALPNARVPMEDIEDANISELEKIVDKNDDINARPLTQKDFENGRRLTDEELYGSKRDSISDHLMNDRNLFEGDIILPNRTQANYLNAVRQESFKWSNGRIPYVLSNDYSELNRSLIARAFEEFHNKTCIRFVPKRWYHLSYIKLEPGNGCASLVGKLGGSQMVSLDSSCLTLGIIEHELMHAIGFWHEQSRADRDDWVRINWDNVEKGMEGNFVKFSWNDITSLGVEYDYASILHYGTHAFSKGFGSTLSPLKDVPRGVKIGQRTAMSDKDIIKINYLYECKRDGRRDGILTSIIRMILGRG